MAERVAIVGVGQTVAKGKRPDVSETELIEEAVRAALENAELTMRDIGTVVIGNMPMFEGIYNPDAWQVEGSGLYMKPGIRATSGGSTGSAVLSQAIDFAASGLFNTVLAIGWEKQDECAGGGGLGLQMVGYFYDIKGAGRGAAQTMANLALDVLERGASTEEQAAEVRVKQAEDAMRNPHAHLRGKLTVEEVMNSRVLMWPLRLLHMCPTTVSACAVILAPEEKAKRITSKPVWVVDKITVHGGMQVGLGENWQGAPGPLGPQWSWCTEQCFLKLYKRNGITNPRKELDVIEFYSPSTWHEIDYWERAHLCELGEAHKLIKERATWLDGDIPCTPSGGVTCSNAIGSSAILRPAEVAIQLRGEAGEHQVPDAKLGIGHGQGGDQYGVAFLLSNRL